ncbi:hypothetical protein Dimus_003822, partial [Dionaea muscipula]
MPIQGNTELWPGIAQGRVQRLSRPRVPPRRAQHLTRFLTPRIGEQPTSMPHTKHAGKRPPMTSLHDGHRSSPTSSHGRAAEHELRMALLGPSRQALGTP